VNKNVFVCVSRIDEWVGEGAKGRKRNGYQQKQSVRHREKAHVYSCLLMKKNEFILMRPVRCAAKSFLKLSVMPFTYKLSLTYEVLQAKVYDF